MFLLWGLLGEAHSSVSEDVISEENSCVHEHINFTFMYRDPRTIIAILLYLKACFADLFLGT